MDLEYSTPVIKNESNKPIPFANQPFPYGSLPSDRRFEELIYSIYKQELENKNFLQFDKIQILKGIKDQGRDCSLHLKGKNTGLIQCKWYTKRLGKSECTKEIINFALNYIVDNSLISDLKDFTYYFAASNGFNDDTLELFSNFDIEIQNEPKLHEWALSILEKPRFKNIKTDQKIFDRLNVVLQGIKVVPIRPQDLDLLLVKPCNSNIVILFFEVRTIDVAHQNYRLPYLDKSIIPINIILEQLKNASTSLSSCKDFFADLNDSHIQREETQKLYSWITNPIKEEPPIKNIILLAGNAGCGKTVILKDLCSKLNQEYIPVLGLKADKLYVNSIKELEEKINIEDTLNKILNSVKETFSTIVIIIDQIDALSQSLSAKREYIDTYIQLINSFKDEIKIRIIISVRIFDLNYDPSLSLYKNHLTISVQPLSEVQVDSILKKLGSSKSLISSELYQLLRTPNHLDVFCRIYKSGAAYVGINNIQDLYLELWKAKILNINAAIDINTNNIIELLHSIAKNMHETQKICISEILWHNKYFKELKYLQTENLLICENNQIQFFHQSFYDYVFAKQFIESGKSLIEYLKENQQSIFIRSSFKMLINYLYLYDHNKYIKIVSQILTSKQFRFHIKLLTINTIGFIDNPTFDDKKVVTHLILSNEVNRKVFIESVNSRAWILYLIDEKDLDKSIILKKTIEDKLLERIRFYEYKSKYNLFKHLEIPSFEKKQDVYLNLCLSLIIRRLPFDSDLILLYLTKIQDFKNKGTFILRILYFLNNWSDDNAYLLFEQNRSSQSHNRFGYFKLLEDITEYRPEYVLEELRREFSQIDFIQIRSNSNDDFDIERILKKLLLKYPENTLDFLLKIIGETVEKNKYEGSVPSLQDDFIFYSYERNDAHETGLKKYFSLALKKYEEFAFTKRNKFLEIFDRYKESNFETELKFLIFGLLKATHLYTEQSFYLIKRLHKLQAFKQRGTLQYLVRQLMKNSFLYYSDLQKEILLNVIIGIHENKICYFSDSSTGNNKIRPYWGVTKFLYLKCLPEEFINSQPIIKKIYLELQRKEFKIADDDFNNARVKVTRNKRQISKDISYDKISLTNWYKLLSKYNSYEWQWHNNLLQKNLNDYSGIFSEEVKKRPNFFLKFIENIISDFNIHEDYIIKGLEGLKGANFNPDETQRLFKLALIRIDNSKENKNSTRDNTMSLFWIAKYFIDSQNIDIEVLNFIILLATTHPDPEKEEETSEDKINRGLNSVRGASSHALTLITHNPDYKTLIFDTLFRIAKNDIVSVKAIILYRLACLMNLDKELTLKLFLFLMNNAHPKLFKPSIWSAQYLADYNFNKLYPYFEEAINIEEVQEDITIILFHAWVKGKKGALTLFERILSNNFKAQSSAINVAFVNLKNANESKEKKYLKILYRYLSSKNSDIINAYAHGFLEDNLLSFEDLYPFLKKYSKSNVCATPPSYFLEYLFKKTHSNPVECIKLLSNLNFTNITENDRSDGLHEEAVKVVVGVYNSIRKSNSKKFERKTLDILDRMLKQQRFRDEATKVIETVAQ